MYDLDKFLVSSLAIRHGLMEEEIHVNEETPIENKDEILSKEIYKQLRNEVQVTVRQQFSIEETDPQQARNPIVRSKFNNIVDYQIKNMRLDVKEPDIPVIAEKLFSDILGYGPLEKYFNDPNELNNSKTSLRVASNGKFLTIILPFLLFLLLDPLLLSLLLPTLFEIFNCNL